jgi:hypothetical protein
LKTSISGVSEVGVKDDAVQSTLFILIVSHFRHSTYYKREIEIDELNKVIKRKKHQKRVNEKERSCKVLNKESQSSK